MTGKKNKWSALGVSAVSLLLLFFVNYKAAVTSFTHDESFTTLHFFPQPELDILFYRHPYTSVITNNHIFNTYMMKLSESIFGFSEWALRLPNILSLVIYLCFGFLLLQPIRVPWLKLFSFLLLAANPYLLDFFGLARGYGLSIGLMVASLYYLLRYIQVEKRSSLWAFHLLGVLSVMSNFAVLNFYVAGLGCLYLIPWMLTRNKRRSILAKWSFHTGNALAGLILAGLLYAPFKVMLANNTVSFGGKQGFFSDTVLSVIRRSLYETECSDSMLRALGYLVCFLVLFPSILIILRWIKGRKNFFEQCLPLVLCNGLCVGITLLTILQHHLLGQNYLMDRFAIFLYPLFILNLIFFIHWMWNQKAGKKMAFAGMLVSIMLLLSHTLIKLNTKYYLNWKYDKDTKTVMTIIRENRPKEISEGKVKIGVFHKLEPTMNLYRRWWELDWIATFDRNPPESKDDFVYMLESEREQLGISPDSEVLFRSVENNLVLLRMVNGRRLKVWE